VLGIDREQDRTVDALSVNPEQARLCRQSVAGLTFFRAIP
jgi:hypothetical protein